jgi:serine/threonine-protein kinase SRPK3
MASSLLRRAWKSIHRLSWKPLAFPNEGIATIFTDIKEANILLPADQSVMTEFEKEELDEPSLKKEFNGSIIYLSRTMGMPRAFGAPVLCDFGSAVPLDDGLEHREDIQPNVYRAPEIILDIPWT